MLAPGGTLVYATCSVLRAENESVVADFLAAHPHARVREVPAAYGVTAGQGRQNLPGSEGLDGFFYASVGKVDR
jgi:16S rRNA (cytosine967-C5)-methyltransferase